MMHTFVRPAAVAKINRQITFASKPAGPLELSNFALREDAVPVPRIGEVLVRNEYLSVDAYMRPLLNSPWTNTDNVIVPGDAVGRVVTSRHPLFKAGDYVQGLLGWQDFAAAPWYMLRKLDPGVAPVSTALGILGSAGLTAYFGLFWVAGVAPGETVVISAAAGGVGSAASQLAKIAGCRVIGITGTDDKVRYLTEDLHVDVAFNYKAGEDWRSRLGVQCPFGVNVYFDNVGGRISDAVLRCLTSRSRVAVCGQISEYNTGAAPPGPRLLSLVFQARARLQGFLVSDFHPQFPQALAALTGCYRAGLLRNRESVQSGLENAPAALVALLAGGNIGKQLVKIE